MKQDFYNSPRVSSQYIFCPFPFVFDTHSGCPHGCKYCFSYANRIINQATQGKAFKNERRTSDLAHLERILAGKPKRKDERELCNFTKLKIPIHWGGLTDPFSRFEKDTKVSLGAMKLFRKYKYPFIVSTKNSRLASDEYMEILKDCTAIVQISLISLDERLEKIETDPEIKIKNRLDMIEKIAKTGKKVVVRLQPFIPIFCEKGIEKFIKEVARRGAKAITVEFLKIGGMTLRNVEVRKVYEQMGRTMGFNIFNYYKKYGKITASDLEIKAEYKIPTMRRLRRIIHLAGMEFYCADNALREMGDSYICCGLKGNEKGFERRNEFCTNRILFEARKKGFATMEDLLDYDADLFDKIGVDWFNQGTAHKHRIKKRMSAKDEAIRIWNTPRSGNSMSGFFYCMEYAGLDENKNAVYRYNRKKGDQLKEF